MCLWICRDDAFTGIRHADLSLSLRLCLSMSLSSALCLRSCRRVAVTKVTSSSCRQKVALLVLLLTSNAGANADLSRIGEFAFGLYIQS